MSALPKTKLTPAEYLEIERKAAFRSEFYDGEMFAMAGASREHNAVKSNLEGELFLRFKGSPCHTTSSDQRILVAPSGLYTYPDIAIICGEDEYAIHDRDTLVNPTIIVEVLSDSTEKYDRTTKLSMYQKIESLKEYIMVAQDRPWCERIARGDDGTWTRTVFAELTGELAFASLPVKIPLADIYARVAFPEFAPPATGRRI